MKKIMFNDRFGLTEAVLEGKKTVTRQLVCKQNYDEEFDDSVDRFNRGWIDYIELIDGRQAYTYKTPYKVGEVVAVAQNYREAYNPPLLDENGNHYVMGNMLKGWNDKRCVCAELMTHQIRILSVTAERLQDITDDDCLREGIYKDDCKTYFNGYAFELTRCEGNCILATHWYKFPRGAYSDLIDKIHGNGTWKSNPWVWRIEFELIK